MTFRTTLYAHAIRNQVGRTFGLAAAYTPAQRATAKAMWDVFKAAGYDDDSCAALLGNSDGECSFLVMARGDHGQAGGAAQWWNARRQIIKTHTGIDVWTADATGQAQAIIAEMSQAWSAYRHVNSVLRTAKDIQAKVTALVVLYEQSASHGRDIARRTPMAIYWKAQFGAPEATA